jgi:hypothetical protein
MGSPPFIVVQDDEKLYDQIKSLDLKEQMLKDSSWEKITLEC